MGTIAATSLRFRPAGEKAEICTQVAEKVWPKIASGEIRPAPETRVPFDEVRRAHKILESGRQRRQAGPGVLSNIQLALLALPQVAGLNPVCWPCSRLPVL